MNRQSDQELLRDYISRRSEAAFAELVRRHIDFIYSAALRMVRHAPLAEDVTQGVFVALAKNASQLADHPVLSGWLHRTAQNIAANAVRSDSRRRAREQEVVTMNQLLSSEPDATWEHIAPYLDLALSELTEADRDVLLLRYFERKSAREIAQALGTSDDAAQKRVNRAVDRLRESFSKRNVTIGAGGLVVLLSANAVHAAPAGLAVTISATGAAILTTTTITTHATMNWLTLKTLSAIFSAAVLTGTTVHLLEKSEIKNLQAERGGFTTQIDTLTAERDAATAVTANLKQEIETLQKDHGDLLRLRGEVGVLRRQASELQVENRSLRGRAAAPVVQPATQPVTQAPAQTTLSPEAARNRCINALRQIDGAMQQFALENRLSVTNIVTADNIAPYIKGEVVPQCPSGGIYTFGSLTNNPHLFDSRAFLVNDSGRS